MKRLFDIVFSGLGMLALLPVGVVISLVIKLSDGGPVFLGHTRVGRFGRPFRIWKFRSMVANADTLRVPLTREKDPRITPTGRFLRKTKLDELPQLWNVFVGDMSFVGPRPEVARYVERYTPEQREILKSKPGITDMATLMFRNEEALLHGAEDVEEFYLRHCLPKKIELNLDYARRANLLRDLWIMIQTLCPYWLGVLMIYAVALTAGFWLSYELRSDFRTTQRDFEEFRRHLPWVVFPQLILLFWRGQMRGLISYFSIPEMRRTVTALGLAFLLQLGLCRFSQGHLTITTSLLLIDFIVSFFVLCAVRMTFRFLREHLAGASAVALERTRQVAIVGTGELATNLALASARGSSARRVVAFFDDNPHTWHTRPHDIPVVGMPECLLNPEWSGNLDEVIIALPEAESRRAREIGEMLRILPLKVTLASSWPVLVEA